MKVRIPPRKEKEHPLDPPTTYTNQTDFNADVKVPYVESERITPAYIRRWQRYLFEHIKDYKILSDWKYIELRPSDLGFICREKIPLKWTVVESTGYPENAPSMEDGPKYGYVYSDVLTNLGNFRIDLMWKWYFDYHLFSEKLEEILGVLALLSSENRILAKFKGQTTGGYCLSPFGIHNDKIALNFDSFHWQIDRNKETYFYIWEKPAKKEYFCLR